MVKFQGGVKAAAKMLQGLAAKDRERVLKEIMSRDPSMAEALKQYMVTFEDLRFLSVKQLQEFLRLVKIGDLALGLRAASNELKDYFAKNLPRSLKQEIDDVLLGPPQSLSKVGEAQDKVVSVLRTGLDQGKFVLASDNDEFV